MLNREVNILLVQVANRVDREQRISVSSGGYRSELLDGARENVYVL